MGSNANTYWAGDSGPKLYITSGEFSSTLKDSHDTTTQDVAANGNGWDGTNTPWLGDANDKMFLQSGGDPSFSTTVKTSIASGDSSTHGISSDEALDTLFVGAQGDNLELSSGQFSTTLRDSEFIRSIDTTPTGISCTDIDAYWCAGTSDKLFHQSGIFTSTIKSSLSINSVEASPTEISFNRTNTIWCGKSGNKLYKYSGFTTTFKTSQDIDGVDTQIEGVEVGAVDDRLNITGGGGGRVMSSLAGSGGLAHKGGIAGIGGGLAA